MGFTNYFLIRLTAIALIVLAGEYVILAGPSSSGSSEAIMPLNTSLFVTLQGGATTANPSADLVGASQQAAKIIDRPEGFSALSAAVFDVNKREYLFDIASDQPRQPASITKLVSAVVFIENFSNWKELRVTMTKSAASVEGKKAGHRPGEQYRAEDLLRSALIGSNNDAMMALVETVPGDFVEKMKILAWRLGLENTSFENPIGISSPEHWMSADDIIRVVEYSLRYSALWNILGMKETTIQPLSNPERQYHIRPLHDLFDIIKRPGFLGVKTGWTPEAQETMVAVEFVDNDPLIFVVLGSQDRQQDILTLRSLVLERRFKKLTTKF